MAKKKQAMYKGMPVIEVSDQKALEKKLEKMEEQPEKYAIRIPEKKNNYSIFCKQ